MGEGRKKHIVMAKSVARKWLEKRARAEYRFDVYTVGECKVRKLPSLLKSFRDSKAKLASVSPIPDLGIKIRGFDSLELWSSNLDSLKTLQTWLEKRGFETSAIW